VKTINHFEQNRPVHLALRDVYYDRAATLLKDPRHIAMQELVAADFEEILFLLRTARNHSFLAVRDNGKNEKDDQFCKFINMLAGNMKSVLSMLSLKHTVEVEGGFFFSFLEANHASVALQAEEHERRARDIICCVLNTLELASAAFEGLKKANYDAFSESECERYEKAAAHHRELIEQRLELPQYKKRSGVFA
jgi:hypothetical protein